MSSFTGNKFHIVTLSPFVHHGSFAEHGPARDKAGFIATVHKQAAVVLTVTDAFSHMGQELEVPATISAFIEPPAEYGPEEKLKGTLDHMPPEVTSDTGKDEFAAKVRKGRS